MTIDLLTVLYVENALLTGGVSLGLMLRAGHHILAFKDNRDFMPPASAASFAAALWPATWALAVMYGLARAVAALLPKPE